MTTLLATPTGAAAYIGYHLAQGGQHVPSIGELFYLMGIVAVAFGVIGIISYFDNKKK